MISRKGGKERHKIKRQTIGNGQRAINTHRLKRLIYRERSKFGLHLPGKLQPDGVIIDLLYKPRKLTASYTGSDAWAGCLESSNTKDYFILLTRARRQPKVLSRKEVDKDPRSRGGQSFISKPDFEISSLRKADHLCQDGTSTSPVEIPQKIKWAQRILRIPAGNLWGSTSSLVKVYLQRVLPSVEASFATRNKL